MLHNFVFTQLINKQASVNRVYIMSFQKHSHWLSGCIMFTSSRNSVQNNYLFVYVCNKYLAIFFKFFNCAEFTIFSPLDVAWCEPMVCLPVSCHFNASINKAFFSFEFFYHYHFHLFFLDETSSVTVNIECSDIIVQRSYQNISGENPHVNNSGKVSWTGQGHDSSR